MHSIYITAAGAFVPVAFFVLSKMDYLGYG